MLPPAPVLDAMTTTGGFLLVLSIVVPVAGVLLAFILGDRYVRLVAYAIIPLGLAIAVAILVVLPHSQALSSIYSAPGRHRWA
jgi:multicomponent Na+:H+ antiporter subunit D